MKKYLIILTIAFSFISFLSKADEGMWIPGHISEMTIAQMQEAGLELTAEQIASFNESSLKDAIFQLQDANGMGFCTGEIVSKEGLMFTNHHCAYPAITAASTVEANYLDDGFWAREKSEEISLPNVRVSRVVRIDNVTARVLEGIDYETSESDREKSVNKKIKEIEKEAKEDNAYDAKVHTMYQGGEYYLFVYEIFGDVRLVGAPPSSIGKFGGDTDNWMWPRHTGDFAILRVYMSPDGNPTKKYEADNIPYQPLHSLPISIKEKKEGDFTMIMGYPGVTERFLSSYGMEYKRDYFNPIVIDLLKTKIDIILDEMLKDDGVRLAYSDTYAELTNGHKLFSGERETLIKTDAIQQKEKYENKFQEWVNSNTDRKNLYGDVLENLQKEYEKYGPVTKDLLYLSLGLLQSSDKVMKIQEFMGLHRLLEDSKENASKIESLTKEYLENLDSDFEDYYPEVDKRIFAALLKQYYNDVDAEKRSPAFAEYIMSEFGKKKLSSDEIIDVFADEVFSNSIFVDKNRMKEFLENPKFKTLDKDPLFIFTQKVFGGVMGIQGEYMNAMNTISVNERLFIEAMRKFEPNKDFYPDANSTLRLSNGEIKSYYPRDAVYYKHITYIDGKMEKEDPNHFEFVIPEEVKKAYENKNYGRYVDHTGNLPVNFLSTNDITGGNSGSPILNGKGEFIGIAFDGNWEWLCSNLIYSPELQRTINVDSRYMLWVIDKLYGAKNIIQELDIRE